MEKIILHEKLPLQIRNKKNLYINNDTTSQAVFCIVFDKEKKQIRKVLESKCLQKSHLSRPSVHAEELAISYLLKNNLIKKKKIQIIIFKINKKYDIKSKYCCYRCVHIMEKYNFKRVFTFHGTQLISAIPDNPVHSLGDLLKK